MQQCQLFRLCEYSASSDVVHAHYYSQRIHCKHVRQLFRLGRLERPIQDTCQTTQLRFLQGCEILLEGEFVSIVKVEKLGLSNH